MKHEAKFRIAKQDGKELLQLQRLDEEVIGKLQR